MDARNTIGVLALFALISSTVGNSVALKTGGDQNLVTVRDKLSRTRYILEQMDSSDQPKPKHANPMLIICNGSTKASLNFNLSVAEEPGFTQFFTSLQLLNLVAALNSDFAITENQTTILKYPNSFKASLSQVNGIVQDSIRFSHTKVEKINMQQSQIQSALQEAEDNLSEHPDVAKVYLDTVDDIFASCKTTFQDILPFVDNVLDVLSELQILIQKMDNEMLPSQLKEARKNLFMAVKEEMKTTEQFKHAKNRFEKISDEMTSMSSKRNLFEGMTDCNNKPHNCNKFKNNGDQRHLTIIKSHLEKANQFEEKGVTTMWMNGTFKCINNLPIIGTLDTENLMKTWKSIHSGMTDYIDVNANAPTPMDNFVYEKWEGKDDPTYYESMVLLEDKLSEEYTSTHDDYDVKMKDVNEKFENRGQALLKVLSLTATKDTVGKVNEIMETTVNSTIALLKALNLTISALDTTEHSSINDQTKIQQLKKQQQDVKKFTDCYKTNSIKLMAVMNDIAASLIKPQIDINEIQMGFDDKIGTLVTKLQEMFNTCKF